ncbi:MAG: hypothetical protein AAFX79_10530 [Planctomycetota bacterium]
MLAGCAGYAPSPIEPTDGPSSVATTRGDWDDVPRALAVALAAGEAALLDADRTPDRYAASLLVIEDRRGTATARRNADGSIELRVFVEPAGDRVAQARLLRAWRRRLDQLYGVEFAPR